MRSEDLLRWTDAAGPVVRAFTSRSGGVSVGPYAEFNLATHVGDRAADVAENRRRLADRLDLPADRVVYMDQQHGTDVAVVTEPSDRPPVADAMVTTATDLALAVLVADCTPVLLADTERGVIAAAHAGRKGFTAGIVDRVVGAMRAAGAVRIEAAVGPSVCGRCYEVPAEMRAEAAAVVPESATVSWAGTPAVDIAAGVVSQLRANDVAVAWAPGCTREDPDLFSHRRDGTTGRTAGVIVRRSS